MINQFEMFAAWARARFGDENGAGMVEYALLVALIGIALIAILGFLKGGIEETFSSSGSTLSA